MDDFAKEVITKWKHVKKEKRQFNKYDMAIGLFYGVGIFLGIGDFLCWRFYDNVGCRVGSITIWRWLFFSCIWLDMPCSYYIEKK